MLEQFMSQLSTDLGLIESKPLDDGSYLIILEPNLQISLRENPESGITLLTTLAPLPDFFTEEFLLYIMSANLLGRETGGSTFGLDKKGKNITLLRFLPQQLSYRDFCNLLEDFANYAEAWRQEILDFVRKHQNIA